jgi:hypothetical protein
VNRATRSRAVALGLAALATATWAGIAAPARRDAARARHGLAVTQEELLILRTRVAALERTTLADRRLTAAFRSGGREPVGDLRRAILAALDGAPVSGVRLGVRPARPPLAASARLVAEGRFDDLVRLVSRLTEEGALAPERIRFVAGPPLRAEIEGFRLERAP